MKSKKFLCLLALPFLLTSCDLSEITREEANRILQDVINKIEEDKDDLKTTSYKVELDVYNGQSALDSHAVVAFDDENYRFYAEATGTGVIKLPQDDAFTQLTDSLKGTAKTYAWIDGNHVFNYDYYLIEGVELPEGIGNEYSEKEDTEIEKEEDRISLFREYSAYAAEIDIYEANAYLVNLILDPTYILEDQPGMEVSYKSKQDGSINAHIKNSDPNNFSNLYVDIVDFRVTHAKGKLLFEEEIADFELNVSYGVPSILIPDEVLEAL